jgi:hypothetical protein
MNRHFQQIWPKQILSPRAAILLRNAGWLLLLLTFIYCVKLEGIAVGLVLLTGLFTTAACLLALLLHYAPRVALGLMITAPLAALL